MIGVRVICVGATLFVVRSGDLAEASSAMLTGLRGGRALGCACELSFLPSIASNLAKSASTFLSGSAVGTGCSSSAGCATGIKVLTGLSESAFDGSFGPKMLANLDFVGRALPLFSSNLAKNLSPDTIASEVMRGWTMPVDSTIFSVCPSGTGALFSLVGFPVILSFHLRKSSCVCCLAGSGVSVESTHSGSASVFSNSRSL